jgi:hypothetical protein
MGYSEVLCHICGVSFNIGRIRTSTEPRRAAWSNFGPIMGKTFWETPSSRPGSFVGPFGVQPEDCEDSDCMFTVRAIKDDDRRYKFIGGKISLSKGAKKIKDEDFDDEGDGDWLEPQEEQEDEPLEYDSEDESSHAEVDLQNTDVEITGADEASEDESLKREQLRRFWLEGMLETHGGQWAHKASFEALADENDAYRASYPSWYVGKPYHIEVDVRDDIVDDMFPLYSSANMTMRPRKNSITKHLLLGYTTKDRSVIEHIAGAECNNVNGYSGHEISAEEMRGCQTVQCLVRKPPGCMFDALPDDEAFEITGEFFLSGLSDFMPSRDTDSPRVTPDRHGCEVPHAENYMWVEDEAQDYAMPFHPPCFEIYKRMSSMSRGKIDVNALTSWWSLEARYDLFREFPCDPNVRFCHEQEWRHEQGTEYLAANPLYIPKLRDIFTVAVDTGPVFSPRNGAFTNLETMQETTATDPFDRLPVELRTEILDNLPSKSIASLRLASRVFSQLPIAYFQTLLRREHPWLWEAWPTNLNPTQTSYPKWAYSTASEIGDRNKRQTRDFAILDDYCRIVKEEMPEFAEEVDEAYAVRYREIQEAHTLQNEGEDDAKPFYLPPSGTNYFVLYTLITRHWQQLRGLQNRKRIWTDCAEILGRIDMYKAQGRIDETGVLVGNLRDIVRLRH